MHLWPVATGIVVALQIALSYTYRRKRKQDEETYLATIAFLRKEREDERQGRIKAEKELRQLRLQGPNSSPPTTTLESLDLTTVPFPLRPIGTLHSCFTQRNGTPRQPLLIPAALAKLKLRADLSPEFLHGLDQYSHCIILYIFHENTDLQRLWQPGSNGVRGKIRVPRLDGGKLGVFATRSPHRPCPIGLSVARIVGVEGGTLIVAGADIVDGTPVLDVKPYVPFSDAIADAVAPAYVTTVAEDEPLHSFQVAVTPAAEAALEECWHTRRGASVYDTYAAFRALVVQVLARDFRSVAQRIKLPGRAAATTLGGADSEGGVKWHVVLDGIDVGYDIDDPGQVTVQTATMYKP